MIPLSITALVILMLGLLPTATAAAIRYEMSRNPRVIPSALRSAVWATLQWGGLALMLFVLPQILLLSHIGVIVGALLVSFLILALVGQHRESVAVLNESVRVLCRQGGSLPDLAEAFSRGDPSVLSSRVRRFGDALRRGVPAGQAARRHRLPLDGETMLALDHCGQAAWRQAGQEVFETPAYRANELPRSPWPAASQAAYFIALVAMTMFVSAFLVLYIAPVMQELSREFGVATPLSRAGESRQLQWILTLPAILAAILAAWGLLHLVYWITDWRWISRLLPLSGPLMRARRRGPSLRGLAAAIDAGNEASQALTLTSSGGFRPAEASRLRRAAGLAASGADLGGALQQAGLVSGRQRPWIDAAATTGRLAEALRSIAAAADRHAQIRFESSASILFPLGVLGCGLLILWTAKLIFGSLVDLILELSHAML